MKRIDFELSTIIRSDEMKIHYYLQWDLPA